MSNATLTNSEHIPAPTILPPGDRYNPFPKFFEPYFGAVFMETFLYGIYCVLFCICAYVLIRKRKTLHWILLSFAFCMFALATADISYTYYIFFTKLLGGTLNFKHLYPKYALFVTNTALADTLLLYRCYVVWGQKKRVIIGPLLLLVAGTVCGYLFEGASINLFQDSWVYLAMTFALNVILTGLTAGRIWYLASKAESILGQGLLKRYNASIAILIESGSIYSAYLLLDMAFQNHATANAILDAGLIQVVGIVPTLIIVQVGLGRAIHGIEDDASSRIETNKASGQSFSLDGNRSIHDARSSFFESIRSHRGSNATLNHELNEHRRSFRSNRSQNRSLYDGNTSRRTAYDLNLGRGDPYTVPSSPRSLPPSPFLIRPEMSRSFEGKIYQPFSEAITLVNSRDSTRTNDIYFSA